MKHGAPRFALAAFLAIVAGMTATQPAAAQGGRLRHAIQARRAARMGQKAAPNMVPNEGAAAKPQPNLRALDGLPPKWAENLRDMTPEEQERFMQNNERFKSLTPERQQQVRDNLQKWNGLTPEQQAAFKQREAVLQQMSPEQRQYFTQTVLPKWNALPLLRRQAINRHLAVLRNLSPETQQTVLSDPRFLQGLSPEEQQLLKDLNSLRNPPPE